jgi:DNA-binding response OmpR family regulator
MTTLRKFKVLIIDDDPSQTILLQKIIENIGPTVSITCTIEQAQNEITHFPPHLIILDLHLGEENGFIFLEKNVLNLKKTETKIIVLSRFNKKSITKKALTLGADDFLLKPINAKDIIQSVTRHLKERSTLKYSFSQSSENATLEFPGEITRFNEFEIILNAPVKLNEKKEIVIIKNTYFQKILEAIHLIPSTISYFIGNGRYDNVLKVTGATEETLKDMRSMRKTRR